MRKVLRTASIALACLLALLTCVAVLCFCVPVRDFIHRIYPLRGAQPGETSAVYIITGQPQYGERAGTVLYTDDIVALYQNRNRLWVVEGDVFLESANTSLIVERGGERTAYLCYRGDGEHKLELGGLELEPVSYLFYVLQTQDSRYDIIDEGPHHTVLGTSGGRMVWVHGGDIKNPDSVHRFSLGGLDGTSGFEYDITYLANGKLEIVFRRAAYDADMPVGDMEHHYIFDPQTMELEKQTVSSPRFASMLLLNSTVDMRLEFTWDEGCVTQNSRGHGPGGGQTAFFYRPESGLAVSYTPVGETQATAPARLYPGYSALEDVPHVHGRMEFTIEAGVLCARVEWQRGEGAKVVETHRLVDGTWVRAEIG